MKFLKEGFDVFVLESFEDKSGCQILDLLEFVKKMFEPFLFKITLLSHRRT